MITAEFKGGKELEAALLDLPKKFGRPAMLAALKEAAEPMVDTMRDSAPRDTGRSAETIAMRSTRVAGFEETIAIGPTSKGFPLMFQEFGTAKQPARPWMRPAWDTEKEGVLRRAGAAMWSRIQKAAARYAAKMAKAKS